MGNEKNTRQRMSKPTVVTIASLLGITCAAGGTIAYFVSAQNKINSQTVGSVSIETAEPSFPKEDKDGNGVPDECEKLIPYQEVAKDPQITNTGLNDAVVFFKMTVPVEEVTLVNEDGTSTKAVTDLYWFKQKDDAAESHQNNFNPNWVFLGTVSSAKSTSDSSGSTVVTDVAVKQNGSVVTTNEEKSGITYVFGYKTRLAPGDTTASLFDKIQNKKYGSANIGPNETENVVIESYAIQADDVLKADSEANGHVVSTNGDITAEDLTYIYNTFLNQNCDILK